MVYLATLFLWRIRVCGVFVFGLSVHALRLVLYCLFPVVGCRLHCYDLVVSMDSLYRCLYLSVLLLSFCHGLYDTQTSFVLFLSRSI